MSFTVFASLTILIKIVNDSVKEGTLCWPDKKESDNYRFYRAFGHTATAVSIVVLSFFIILDNEEWNNKGISVSWSLLMYITASIYGLALLPAILALSNSSIWMSNLRQKQRLSVVVVKEIITLGFSLPLIVNLKDIVDDSDDSEWRHLAASLVFTWAVIHFVIFWYITNWNVDQPLENDVILSKISNGSGMLILYIVVIRRLHQNKLLTEMGFVSEKDSFATVGAVFSIFISYLIVVKNMACVKNNCAPFCVSTCSSAVIMSVLIVILILMLISVSI